MKLEQEIRMLTAKLIMNDGEIFSVDEMIRQAKERRVQNRKAKAKNYANTPSWGMPQPGMSSMSYTSNFMGGYRY
jgi:hypothetical protein